jgi:hypothetical protein
MARLYADEDFSYPMIQRLRQLGHDILSKGSRWVGRR